ncbi:ATP-binding protein [Chryseobacterium gallinarum]|nr:ATP-binding protein [Chryseobacterium gallinarum]
MDINHLKKYECENAPPHAGNMIKGYRSIGYNLGTAVADIIDNSIAADAKNIWIDFEWNGKNTALTITDDGNGMSLKELVIAMTPASKDPLLERFDDDLGRFGLGLKTASFSQCRILTVATKQLNTDIIFRSWNMDYVNEAGWKLLNYLNDETLINRLLDSKKGTTVIWQDIDHLTKNTIKENQKDLEIFLTKIKQMEMHLSMVFHLFIQTKKLNISINNVKIRAWDPYITTNHHTQKGIEYILRDGITVQSFILPHTSELSKEDFDNGGWIKGWNAQQGFYIYRNNRMIIAGEWLGMYKQEEHNKLSRIKVNIPNTAESDLEWQLDIKKSVIQVPHDIRQKLKNIADESRKDAVEVYRKIGKREKRKSTKEDIPVWMPHKRKGKRGYQINKEHPLIKNFIYENSHNKAKLNRFFYLLEETLPLSMIIINESEYKDMQQLPFEGKSMSDLINMITELYQSLVNIGLSHEDVIEEILRTEPFNHYPELTENIQNEH